MSTETKSVLVRLLGDSTVYRRSVADAERSTGSFQRAAQVGFAAAATAAVAFARKSVDTTVTYGKAVGGLRRISGDSAEQMSRLAFAGKMTGTTTDTLATGFKFLQKNMAAGNQAFSDLGITTTGADGKLRGTHDVLLDTADAIRAIENPAERTAAMLKIFGRGGLDMGRLLAKGADGIRELEAAADKYGLVLTGDNMAAIQGNITAHREMDAAVQGLQVQLGLHLLPILTDVTTGFATLVPVVTSNLEPIAAVGASLVGITVVAPRVMAMMQGMTASAAIMQGAMIGLSGAGIGMALMYLDRVKQTSRETQEHFNAGIDWTDYAAGADAINAEGRAVDELGAKWNAYNAAEKATNSGDWKIREDLAAQYEEDLTHIKEIEGRIGDLGGVLGIGFGPAADLVAQMGVDLSQLDQAIYTPIFEALSAGAISASDASDLLTAALDRQAAAGQSDAEQMKVLAAAIQAKADAEKAILDPQFAAVSAMAKLHEAQAAYDAAMAQYGKDGAETQQAALDLAKSNADLDYALSALGMVQDTGDQSGALFAGWQQQGRMTEDAIHSVGTQFDAVKATAEAWNGTTYAADIVARFRYESTLARFADPVGAVMERVNAAIGSMPPAVAPIDAYIGSYGGGLGGPPSGHATGGTLDEGWNLVNEQGPELLYKSGSTVQVMTAAQTAASGGGRPGGYTHNGNIVIQTPTTEQGARELVWQQRKAALVGAY